MLGRVRGFVADPLLLLAAVVTVLPLWSAKYLPIADIPEHVAVMATLRHWTDASWNTGATYTFAFAKSQYLAYHLLGALLAFPLGADLANRVLLTAVGIVTPYAMRALLRAFGTEERVAILACPLFWSRPLVLGFLPYVAALPVVFFTLSLIVRQRRAETRGRAIAIGALAILAFYLHISAYAVLVVIAFALAFVPSTPSSAWSSTIRPVIRTFLSLAPSILCAMIWAVEADPRGGPMLLATEHTRGPPSSMLGALFAAWAHDIWTSRIDEIEGAVFWIVVLWLGLQRGASEPDGGKGVLARLAPFASVLLLFVALPYRLGAGAMLNVRLAPLLAYLALPVLRPDPGARSRMTTYAGVALSVAVSLTAVVEIRRSQRELGDFDAVLAHIRPGARLLALHFNPDSTVVQGPAWIHVQSYHRLRSGGVGSLSFSEMAHWPIRYRAEARPPPKEVTFWDFRPCLFRNTIDGDYYDFILSRGDVDPFANNPRGPSWRRVAVIGPWRVDEKIAGRWHDDTKPDRGPCVP